MKKEKVRELDSVENDALYWALLYAEKNPSYVGLDEKELQSAKELLSYFRRGKFRISEKESLIK